MISDSPGRSTKELIWNWTIKEAYTKAIGVGVALDFKRIAVLFDDLPGDLCANQATADRCDRCEGCVDIEVDGKKIDGEWHVRLTYVDVGQTVGGEEEEKEEKKQYLWATVWWQEGNERGCKVEYHVLNTASLADPRPL